MKRSLLAGMLFLGAVSTPGAAMASASFDVYGSVENFLWKEYVGGGLAAREEDPVYTLGIAGRYVMPRPGILTLKVLGEGFGGSIDRTEYSPEFYSSSTDLSGFRFEGSVGMLLRLPAGSLEPFAGVGYRWFQRDVYYKTETWEVPYGRVGLRGNFRFPESPASAFFEAGVQIPFATHVSTEIPDGSTLYVIEDNPDSRNTAFAEAGVRFRPFKISLYYQGLRFQNADIEIDSSNLTKVKNDTFGVRFGLSF